MGNWHARPTLASRVTVSVCSNVTWSDQQNDRQVRSTSAGGANVPNLVEEQPYREHVGHTYSNKLVRVIKYESGTYSEIKLEYLS